MRSPLLIGLGLLTVVSVAPATAETRYILRADSTAVERIAQANGLTVKSRGNNGESLSLLSDLSGRPAEQVVAAVQTHPEAIHIEHDKKVRVPENIPGPTLEQSTVAILDALSNRGLVNTLGDPTWVSYLMQPATAVIRLREAQSAFGTAGRGVVAIIDTGVDPKHPVLRGALVPGYDFVRDQPGGASEYADLDQSTVAILDASGTSILTKNPVAVNQSTVAILDQSTVAILDRLKLPSAFGHGTMVASLVRLVAPGARIMPLKAFGGDGTASVYDVIRAIDYAVENGAKVINMSFSLEEPSEELQAAISRANDRRVICVAAAGNEGKQTLVYPAAFKKVAGIASTTLKDVRAQFSNYGDNLVSLAAPGEGLITAYPGNNYAAVSGTSFSTPLVAGAVALLADLDPNLNQTQADQALSNAQPAGNGMGAGRIDVFRACAGVGH